jgi:hypothetical protein
MQCFSMAALAAKELASKMNRDGGKARTRRFGSLFESAGELKTVRSRPASDMWIDEKGEGLMTEQMLLRLVGEHAYAISGSAGRVEMSWPDLLVNGWRVVAMVGSGGPDGAAYVLLEREPVKG